jgi:hypothetical protein
MTPQELLSLKLVEILMKKINKTRFDASDSNSEM